MAIPIKVLFGTFASPGDLARNLRTSLAEHEMRLLAYRQNALSLPMQLLGHQTRRPQAPTAGLVDAFHLILAQRFDSSPYGITFPLFFSRRHRFYLEVCALKPLLGLHFAADTRTTFTTPLLCV
jgi:hypothetical protein